MVFATPSGAAGLMPLSAGNVVGRRYRIDHLIATGGTGEVYAATDVAHTATRRVAVKVLRSEFTTNASFIARFRNDMLVSSRLAHPNIATFLEVGEDDHNGVPRAYLVMELVEGPSPAGLLAGGPQPIDRAQKLLVQAADGLAAAHAAGVVHRDAKPANLLVAPSGIVKLTDFGIALARDRIAAPSRGKWNPHRHDIGPGFGTRRRGRGGRSGAQRTAARCPDARSQQSREMAFVDIRSEAHSA
jgi:serine/threonine protein kinase